MGDGGVCTGGVCIRCADLGSWCVRLVFWQGRVCVWVAEGEGG